MNNWGIPAAWEDSLLNNIRPVGDIIFTRLDGEKVRVENANFESVSAVGANAGVIAVEVYDSREIVHVPFVASWTVDFEPYL